MAGGMLVGAIGPAWAATVTVLTPPSGETAYPLAGQTLADLWEKVTGQRPVVKMCDRAADKKENLAKELPEGDLVPT